LKDVKYPFLLASFQPAAGLAVLPVSPLLNEVVFSPFDVTEFEDTEVLCPQVPVTKPIQPFVSDEFLNHFELQPYARPVFKKICTEMCICANLSEPELCFFLR